MWALVVEDDLTTSAGIEMVLRASGHACDTTDLGSTALEFGRVYDYDVILLDLMLPDVAGLEVLRRLRESKVDTPVIIVTGLGDVDDRVRGLEQGADDYLVKPFENSELVGRTEAIVARASAHRVRSARKGRVTMLSEQTGPRD